MKYEKRQPKGGYKLHLVPAGKYRALCGYAPEAVRNRIMKDRTGWKSQPVGAQWDCEECQAKLAAINSKESDDD